MRTRSAARPRLGGGVVAAAAASDFPTVTWYPENEGMQLWNLKDTYLHLQRFRDLDPDTPRRLHAWASQAAGFDRSRRPPAGACAMRKTFTDDEDGWVGLIRAAIICPV
ncbi:hypothetical protein GLOTRDRAFT_130539 [Gloeophyllum trabeum ATCC 11539]|uniref:Uncharacterized protein n=1 Tax=Gloeophyllum trabeum (strain ATCC 11539 / FP-39264 / Madison 617) TaxID=670483 RepID=S7Q3X2_GLOTA|nr:uncharacterized protein GLOTRDRAFT_130539 [Gloeophyllum trabeum ATCC 11539]EPQ54153.1 hypothetical protein GLOTRDRAFT_130539 [Gloeophyllum trabeum ATCC 11539]